MTAPAPQATQLLVYYQPTAPVPAGSPFSLVIHALTSTNALASSYSGTVTLTLAHLSPRRLPGRHHDRNRERRHRLLPWTDFEPARQLRHSGHRQRAEQRQHGHHRAGSDATAAAESGRDRGDHAEDQQERQADRQARADRLPVHLQYRHELVHHQLERTTRCRPTSRQGQEGKRIRRQLEFQASASR